VEIAGFIIGILSFILAIGFFIYQEVKTKKMEKSIKSIEIELGMDGPYNQKLKEWASLAHDEKEILIYLSNNGNSCSIEVIQNDFLYAVSIANSLIAKDWVVREDNKIRIVNNNIWFLKKQKERIIND